MKQIYHIWLADNPTFMDFSESDRNKARTLKGEVEATDVEDAFNQSQNGFGGQWGKFNSRSCSVGDVIQDPMGNFHFVAGVGMEPIDVPYPGYKRAGE